MFYYGLYKDECMKNSKGKIILLSDYERGAIERGMEFIAFSRSDIPTLEGWRHLICGCDLEVLKDECRRSWRMKYGCTGIWEVMRLDREDFVIINYASNPPKPINGNQLTFPA